MEEEGDNANIDMDTGPSSNLSQSVQMIVTGRAAAPREDTPLV
eukprot:COSAG01_NODE_69399_length_261_cov_0.962963_1_plen_42_part_01